MRFTHLKPWVIHYQFALFIFRHTKSVFVIFENEEVIHSVSLKKKMILFRKWRWTRRNHGMSKNSFRLLFFFFSSHEIKLNVKYMLGWRTLKTTWMCIFRHKIVSFPCTSLCFYKSALFRKKKTFPSCQYNFMYIFISLSIYTIFISYLWVLGMSIDN